MAQLHIEFYSQALKRPVPFAMIIPNDFRGPVDLKSSPYWQRPMKVLFMLHGYTGNAYNWGIEDLARKYNFAMVMPNGENGFYLDAEATGHKYATFLGVELVEYLRKTFRLAERAEDTFVMGLSMGGFGALHTALAYPETFGKAGAMSSALIVHGIAHMQPGEDNGVANYAYYRQCFGNLETVEESDANPETLVNQRLEMGKKFPDIYMCCGTEDFLLEENRVFHEFLVRKGVPHEYFESKGVHDGKFWGEYTPKIVKWMFEE